MDDDIQRANQVDQKLKDLERTLQQLQASLPTIVRANASLHPNFEPRTKEGDEVVLNVSSANDPRLSRSNTLKIISKLQSTKAKIIKYDQQREQETMKLAEIRDRMKDELLAIKKEILAENFRQTPQQFRSYLQSQLHALKDEILRAQSAQQHEEKQSTLSADTASTALTPGNVDVLNRVKTELVSIRQEMAQRLTELEQYRQFEREMQSYKGNIRDKLLKVKSEVQQYEQELSHAKRELHRVQSENDDYKKGNRIPKLLQETITSRLNILKEQVFQIETENKTLKMQLTKSDPLLSISKSLYVTTVDMHSAGEPLRIIENGVPAISGSTLLEKQQTVIKDLDYYRRFLMHEPRGHFDMYGAIITEPDDPKQADFAVLFMHNEGYSSMCGHGVLALGRYAVDFGLVRSTQQDEKQENDDEQDGNVQRVRIQCPCGVVTVNVEIDAESKRSTGNVSFVSTPGWAEYISTSIQLDQFGKVEIDIGFGGTYYAICPSTRFNLNVRESPTDDLINISALIKQTVVKKLQLSHPDSKELQFLFGTILTDGMTGTTPSSNVCVFADRQVDRSPAGSGIVARLACDYKKKNIKVGEKRKFIGKTGSVYHGEIVKVLNYKDKKDAVIARVSGTARYISRSQFCLEDGDELGRGFLMK
eukprot:CAMPEP_0197025702 /NCGR_PEP_ID=MMETSP1384-20130603/5946_1 /TAXON_ID=29189 /ORGANISM="Ammonia sp." /LENGTH=648 /DNA_ID=CAMNT_0042454265 /DNA_START=96 /DNA_END=2042 /DNA_ORIENTATION=+